MPPSDWRWPWPDRDWDSLFRFIKRETPRTVRGYCGWVSLGWVRNVVYREPLRRLERIGQKDPMKAEWLRGNLDVMLRFHLRLMVCNGEALRGAVAYRAPVFYGGSVTEYGIQTMFSVPESGWSTITPAEGWVAHQAVDLPPAWERVSFGWRKALAGSAAAEPSRYTYPTPYGPLLPPDDREPVMSFPDFGRRGTAE